MRIVIDQDYNGAYHVADHVIHTDRAAWNQVPDPRNPLIKMDMIDFINLLHKTPALLPGTGWEVNTNHPLYVGTTRLNACVSEIVKANDVAARLVLGV